ncbi:glycine oxidase ThiO [Synechococcus sp. PCC 6312]|uniref:glycine oxidase ThiO n=1 Tax=Synechococcus sp. (strain ATCC 27167 / PCC 6312) TaxID=195253 RepID=UPI0002FFCD77|nr:glycine oxidase ThiO [Synechococcus sp. PCC 6312]
MTLSLSEQNTTDVLIVGGGTMGLAIAIELALQGAKPTILTRNLEEAALYAAAGMLAPQAEQLSPGPMLDLCLASRALYPDWISKLAQLTGLDAGYWPCGILTPVYDDQNYPQPQVSPPTSPAPELSDSKNLAAHWLTGEALEQRQPGLSRKVKGAWWYPKDGQVDNRALAKVLLTAARELGIAIKTNTTATEFVTTNQKINGIVTNTGLWQAEQYVLASGAWSQSLVPIPVTPRKGQMLSLKLAPDQPRPLNQVIFAPDVYLVPRQSARIVIGATSEDVDFAPGNTAQGVQQLLNAAIAVCPALAELTIEEIWWGFRPLTPDEWPVLGQGAWDNLWLATGHYRNGILLAPITAYHISESVLKGQSVPSLTPFSYQRFS